MFNSSSRKLKVFLCHAHADKADARSLNDLLIREGFDPWLDELKLKPGQDWQKEITKAVTTSDVIVVCLSESSLASTGYMNHEIEFALNIAELRKESAVFIIPARLDDSPVPERLARWHWVDISNEDGKRKLIDSLKTRQSSLALKKPSIEFLISAVSAGIFLIAALTAVANDGLSVLERFGIVSSQFYSSTATSIPAAVSPVSQLKQTQEPSVQGQSTPLNKDSSAPAQPVTVVVETLTIAPLTGTATPESARATTTPTPQSISAAITTPSQEPAVGANRDFNGIPFVYVPAGEFRMGLSEKEIPTAVAECMQFSDDCNSSMFDLQTPGHSVYLDSYWIMQTEVTNYQYAKCVSAGACTPPEDNGEWQTPDHYDRPVVRITWDQANAFSQWLGGRLPTEAEWEKAACGTDDRVYPWGNTFDGTRLNYCDVNCDLEWKDIRFNDGIGMEPAAANSYPSGASPYGVLGMAGNVSEWTADWYDGKYYANSPSQNPMGPVSGIGRIFRGTSFAFSGDGAACSARNYGGQSDPWWSYDIGFRVVYSGN